MTEPAAPVTESKPKLGDVLSEAMRFLSRQHELQRKELVWGNIRKATWVVFFVFLGLLQFWFLFRMINGGSIPADAGVAVIPVSGPIASNSAASAEKIVPMIEKACDNPGVSDIVLAIDSPGGAPNESERIVRAMEVCKADKAKRFTTIIGSTGASAAYMIAIHGDKLVAGRYSIVGSIGAIMRYVDASAAVAKFGLTERVFKSGTLKGGPSMWSGSDEANDKLNQEMVSVLGKDFVSEVVDQRKGKLKADPNQLSTGRIWTGPQALELGLIDQVATLEDLKATDFKDKEVSYLKPKTPFAEGFGLRAMIKGALEAALTDIEEPTLQ